MQDRLNNLAFPYNRYKILVYHILSYGAMLANTKPCFGAPVLNIAVPYIAK